MVSKLNILVSGTFSSFPFLEQRRPHRMLLQNVQEPCIWATTHGNHQGVTIHHSVGHLPACSTVSHVPGKGIRLQMLLGNVGKGGQILLVHQMRQEKGHLLSWRQLIFPLWWRRNVFFSFFLFEKASKPKRQTSCRRQIGKNTTLVEKGSPKHVGCFQLKVHHG